MVMLLYNNFIKAEVFYHDVVNVSDMSYCSGIFKYKADGVNRYIFCYDSRYDPQGPHHRDPRRLGSRAYVVLGLHQHPHFGREAVEQAKGVHRDASADLEVQGGHDREEALENKKLGATDTVRTLVYCDVNRYSGPGRERGRPFEPDEEAD